MCTPLPVAGSQGPDYPDNACGNAFDGGVDSSWAVDPQRVSDPAGAGSTVEVRFTASFRMTRLRYTQRVGPGFCSGSAGAACKTSTPQCECLVGGDRLLQLEFQDGSTQTVELLNSLAPQEFDLQVTSTDRLKITILSVYSNPRTCPDPIDCPWWEPDCAAWCPNGAAAIEALTTDASEAVFNFNHSYERNYTQLARLVSDVATVDVRQRADVLRLFHPAGPLRAALPVLPGARWSTPRSSSVARGMLGARAGRAAACYTQPRTRSWT